VGIGRGKSHTFGTLPTLGRMGGGTIKLVVSVSSVRRIRRNHNRSAGLALQALERKR